MSSPVPAHVALLVPSFAGGGAERVMVTFANELTRLGARVDLLAGRAAGPYRGEVDPAVRVLELGAERMSRNLPALARYLRRARPRWLVSTMLNANVVAVLAKRLARAETRVWVREAITPTQALRHRSRRARWAFLALWQVYRAADGILAPTLGVADDLRRLLGPARTNIHVLMNPIAVSEIRARAGQPVPERLHALPRPWVVACGRLAPQKDFDTLLRAVAQLRSEGRAPPASLLIVGEGPERARLEQLARALGLGERCLFAGFIQNPFAVFAQAAVFVASSRYEGFPNVLLQAMACGARVVATDCRSGPREILRNEAEGLLVPVGDVAAMAQAIAAQLGAHGDVQPVRRRAEDFSAPLIARQLLDLLQAER